MRARYARVCSRFAIGTLMVLLALAAAPESGAQNLPAPLAAAIAIAAKAPNATRLRAVVVEAIATHPSLAQAIVRHAITLRPQDGATILGHAQAAFPAFADQFAATAGQSVAWQAASFSPAQPLGPTATPSPWSGEIDLGASRVTGNTESAETGLKAKLKREAARWRNEARLEFEFGDDDNVTNERAFLLSFETNYKLTPRVYLFGFASYEDDAFSGFAFRLTETVGLGYGLIRLSDLSLDVEVGAGARQTKIETTNETENEAIGRFDGELFWQVSDHAELGDETTIILGDERTTFDSTVALTSTIIDRLAVRLSFNVEHETNVEPGTKATDTTTKASILYSF